MRRGAAHLTLVLGDPAKAEHLRCALEAHGVDHAAVVAQIGSVRRSLVLGENDFVVVCIALDRSSIDQHGQALRTLLSDNGCFPTQVRTVGLLSDLGLTREAAELGCDVYVEDSAQAAEVIRLIEETVAADPEAETPRRKLRFHGGWMYGSPQLPEELTLLVSSETGRRDTGPDTDPHTRPIDRSDGELRDPPGL
jgi:hypothetical protein